jgi:predicted Ser/Thr protein kinase
MEPTEICPQCGEPGGLDALDGLCPQCMMKVGMGSYADASRGPSETRFEPPAIEDLTPLFPHLEILELLGRGGMGAVYKARQKDLDRLVALKVLPVRSGADPGFAERFTREARTLARLNHPNIVAVHDFGLAGEFHYLLMEYIGGVTLRQVERSGGLTPQQALAIVPQICEALQYAHDNGVVHRDIKPENILLDTRGKAKIADFGLAKLLGRDRDFTLTQPGHVMGTPHYMAPEQVEHPSDVDHRADIYSLGVVFYEMLTGELPLGRFAPPSRKVQIDVRLDEVVLRTLEKEPEQRYQQASQVKTEVETIAASPPASPGPRSRDSAGIEDARRRIRIPAVGLRVGAVLELAPIALAMAPRILQITEMRPESLVVVPVLCTLLAAPAILILIGAAKMERLSSYQWSIAACVAGIAPPLSLLAASPLIVLALFGWLLGIIFGVWSLVLLNRDDIRGRFKDGRDLGAGSLVKDVLLTLAWHSIILMGVWVVLPLYLLPRVFMMYAEAGVAHLGVRLLQDLGQWWFAVLPALVGLDAIACVWAYRSGGRRSLRRWSLVFVLVLGAVVAAAILWILPKPGYFVK